MKNPFVIGHPIRHSKSPLIHNAWIARHGLAGQYRAEDVAPDDLEIFIRQVASDPACPGGNVTLPHKETVRAFVAEVSDTARRIGAVNTLFRDPAHPDRFCGDNTDAYGFSANLDDRLAGWREGHHALVVGAGGASRAVLVALLDAGYRTITLLNRTPARAKAVAQDLSKKITPGPLSDFETALPAADLVVNTSALGLEGDETLPFTFSNARPDTLVTDIVYAPLQTPFLVSAQEQGLQTADGLGMLLHQAVPGFEYWFGIRPVVDEAIRALALPEETPAS